MHRRYMPHTQDLVEVAANQNITERDYWLNKLSGKLVKSSFPYDYRKPIRRPDGTNETDIAPRETGIHFSPEICSRLISISKGSDIRVFIILVTAVVVLLNKYTGNNDIIVGVPIHKQDQEGNYINTVLAVRNILRGEMPFKELLLQVSQTLMEAEDHQNYPIEILAWQVDITASQEGFPLFDIVILLENIHSKRYIRHIPTNMVFSFLRVDDTLQGSVEYNSLRYHPETLERIIDRLNWLLNEALFQVDTKLSALSILSNEEKCQVLEQFNNTYLEYPEDKSINRLFGEQVEKTSDRTALIGQIPISKFQIPNKEESLGLTLNAFGVGHLSYKELDEKANQLSHRLQDKGVKPDTIVGILVNRSIDMIIGIWGILKAGAAYLPIAPESPEDRITYMLADSGADLLVTNGSVLEGRKPGSWEGEIVLLNPALSNSPLESGGRDRRKGRGVPNLTTVISNLKPTTTPLNLAYIIYTSGSTGYPKGVMVEHRNLVNLVFGLKKRIYWRYSIPQKVCLLAPYTFDASVQQIFATLLLGHCLCIVPENLRMDGGGLVKFYLRQNITISDGTPIHLGLLWEYISTPGAKNPLKILSTVKHLLIGGEELPGKLVERFLNCFNTNPPLITNLYGPTECCVDCTTYTIFPGKANQAHIPIGTPMPNEQVYILDKENRLLPVGVVGELCISGDGVGRGYLNKPEMTAEKFIKIKIGNDIYHKSSRSYTSYITYRTGDLARWLSDGNIEFFGRLDYQVKISGYRVELEEIENRLLNHGDIKEAVVIALENVEEEGDNPHENVDGKDKYLAAYFVSPRKFQLSELREYLAADLPPYMIPLYFVPMEKIPVTPNGKVDRKCLPHPNTLCLKAESIYVAPKDDTEKKVAEVWKSVLKMDRMGIDDNFFDIGGNSLHLIRLNSRLKEAFNRDVPMEVMFKYPTVRSLARYFSPGESSNEIVKTDTSKTSARKADVAIIGMAGKFPGAKNIHEFWNNLINGVETIMFFSEEELEKVGIGPKILENPKYVKAMAVLYDEDIEAFDAPFFGYTPREAEVMDPQVRLFHECVWEALEDASYAPERFDGSIGLYAGASGNQFWEALAVFSGKSSDIGRFAAYFLTDKDHLSGQVSYKLNLKGPVLNLQTACSTSLVAVHLACGAIVGDECDMAVTGASAIALPNRSGYMYQEGMVASPDGHCRAFDAQSAGMVAGSGTCAAVLKGLEKAVADGDHIYAVIKGSAINNDGNRRLGYTVPSIAGQVEVIRAAMQKARIKPGDVGYIETHGTATSLGDTVEIGALKMAFNSTKKGSCAIGSIKSNMGHLDTAAGLTGLIKTALALKNELIPPTLHFTTPNPQIDFENSPFYVNTRLQEWKKGKSPRRAGISSFGIGGTNAHVILEEAPETPRDADSSHSREKHLILLSTKTTNAMERLTEDLVKYLSKYPDINLADTAYTLQVGRSAFQYRRMALVANVQETTANLASPGNNYSYTHLCSELSPPVVFMFAGLGFQYVDMGLELYQKESVFREEMDRCFGILKPLLGYDIKEILYPRDSHHSSLSIHHFEVAQLVVFIFEYSLAQLLIKWGIKPHAMIGYSFGEYTAACISGVFSLEDALQLIATRGELIKSLPPGKMLSVPLSAEELSPLLPGELALAIDNGGSSIVAGPPAVVERFEKEMKSKRFICMPLQASYALHSQMMEPIIERFTARVRQITLNKSCLPYIANVTGKWITNEECTDPGYWSRHLRQTVHFAAGIRELAKKSNAIFVEIGPGRELIALASRHIPEDSQQLLINLVRPSTQKVSDLHYLLNKIGQLWLHNVPIDWNEFYSKEKRQRISLPTYPFDTQRYWIEGNPFNMGTGMQVSKVNKGKPGEEPDLSDWFYIPTWTKLPLLSHHKKEAKEISNQSSWLLFIDSCGIGDSLVKRLKQKNHRVIIVKPGGDFNSLKEGIYTINPLQNDDYHRLFCELSSRGEIPEKILHLWGLSGEEPEELSIEQVEKDQEVGFFSLINIAQAIGKQELNSNFQIEVITQHLQEITGEEVILPSKATILGPIKVIPQEYPNITCRAIDIVIPRSPLTGLHQEKLADQLLKEFSFPSPGAVTAYRGNCRWNQVFHPIHLEKKETGTPPYPLRKEGVYLITGGLGHIGFVLAEYLFKKVGARLVLTGRTPLPPREQWEQWSVLENHDQKKTYTVTVTQKIQKLKALEAMGAEVMPISVDVTQPQQMQEAVERAEKRFGRINAVFHLAGIIGGHNNALVEETGTEICQRHFRPKIHGLLVLEKIFQDKSLDFFWVMSSIASVLGGLGFTAYSAANIFMDTYVYYHNRIGSVPWISVDWDGMEPEQTEKAFERIITLVKDNVQQVVVSEGGHLQRRIDQWIKMESRKEITPSQQKAMASIPTRPKLITPYVAPHNQVQETLAQIWQKILGYQQVGIHDDFLELGGDSLKAITIIAAIHKQLGVEVSLMTFFKEPTIGKIAEEINKSGVSAWRLIEPGEKKEYYPLSAAQKRLSIHQQMYVESIAYNVPQALALEGNPDKEKIEKVFRELIQRHESLRTSIVMVDGEPAQVIHPKVEFEIEYHDVAEDREEGRGKGWKGRRNEEKETGNHYSSSIIQNFIRPFDLIHPPFIRVALIKTGEARYILMVDMHHIVTDGISHKIFVEEFISLYDSSELPPLRIQYKDYSQWLHRNEQQEKIIERELYWLNKFKAGTPVLNIHTDFPRPPLQRFEGDSLYFDLGEQETKALKTLALNEDVTLYQVLLAILYILLAKLSGQEDIVIGTPVAGRNHSDLQRIIGYFVNTLALRNFPQGGKSLKEFLMEVKQNTLEDFENQDYPFENLVEKTAGGRDISRNPIFSVLFVLQSLSEMPQVSEPETTSLKISPYLYERSTSKFDLSLEAVEKDKKLFLTMEYCTNLFKGQTIVRTSQYFKRIVSSLMENIQKKISETEIITEEEKMQIMLDFNNTFAEYPSEKVIHELFVEQAARKSDYTAVEFEHNYLTYRELNKKADQLAWKLRKRGAYRDCPVGLMVKPSVEMLICILGILKAGGAYLPIDPEIPVIRMMYILKDSGVSDFLTKTEFLQKFPLTTSGGVVRQILLLDDLADIYAASPVPYLENVNKPTDSAYVLFTSGSTGTPKGVIIEHRSVNNLIYGLNERIYYHYHEGVKVCLISPFVFDASIKQVFSSLLQGHTLVVVPEKARLDGEELLSFYQQKYIRISDGTPAHLTLLLNYRDQFPKDFPVEKFVIGGEELAAGLCREFFEAVGKEKFEVINVYGSTECCDVTTSYKVSREIVKQQHRLAIGKPLGNTKVYIWGPAGELQPIGVPGELCIGGIGVGRGYLNRPELTAEKFDHDLWDYQDYRDKNKNFPGKSSHLNRSYRSYQSYSSKKIYHTGDLARWLPEGNIEFLGRIDHQVKIRGNRIELGEIEKQLLKHKAIKEVAIISKSDESGDKYLCAYIVPGKQVRDEDISAPQLRKYLSHILPDFMIPSYFIPLEQMPFTPNGKLDRKALPKPEIKAGEGYIPPGNKQEEKLVKIWSEVLGIEKDIISIDSSFFDLGGHSLKATIMAARIHKEFQVKLPLAEIFKSPTIRALGQSIQGCAEDKYAPIESVEKKEYYVLSSAQKRMYTLYRMDPNSTAYNIPQVIPIREEVDLHQFKNIFQQLISRHETLRTSFEIINDTLVQKIHEPGKLEFDLQYYDIISGSTENPNYIEHFIHPFDLSIAPLVRGGIYKTFEQGHLLVIDIHHILSDEKSNQLLAREFAALYAGELLPPLKLQYKDYSEWQNSKKASTVVEQQEKYWLTQFKDGVQQIALPIDYERSNNQNLEGDVVIFKIEKENYQKLKMLEKTENVTIFMIMLALYNILFFKLSGQQEIIIGTLAAGRSYVDLENIIGMLVNTLPIRGCPENNMTFRESLNQVKTKALEALANQDYQFEDMVDKLAKKREAGRHPLFDVTFTLNPYTKSRSEIDLETLMAQKNQTVIESKFDLSLSITEQKDNMVCFLCYRTKLFKQETIERLCGYFQQIISSVVTNEDILLGDITINSDLGTASSDILQEDKADFDY